MRDFVHQVKNKYITNQFGGKIMIINSSCRSTKTYFLFLLIFIIGMDQFAYAQTSKGNDIKRVQIPNSQSIKIHSSIVDQEYELQIHYPRGYEESDKKFPVIYLLDSQWDFPLVTALYGQQFYDGFLPGVLIVGITWGGENPNHDYLRARDFTPTNSSQLPQSGGASKFLQFIKEELIPYIDSEYKSDKNKRIIMGSSFGGLFTLYVMFHETELFNGYIAGSPAIQWDNGITFNYEKEFAEKSSKLPEKLYIPIGELEPTDLFDRLVKQLKLRNYEGLELQEQIVKGVGHSGNKADGYTRGLQFVFKRPSLKLDDSILEQYVGNYVAGPGYSIQLINEDSQLIAILPDDQKFALSAESEKDFYLPGQYMFLHFKKDDKGKVMGFNLEQYTGEFFIPKQ